MLVLTRRTNETLVIDGDIEVSVLSVHGDRVRLGIKAPPSMRVDRLEIHQRRVFKEDEQVLDAQLTS